MQCLKKIKKLPTNVCTDTILISLSKAILSPRLPNVTLWRLGPQQMASVRQTILTEAVFTWE